MLMLNNLWTRIITNWKSSLAGVGAGGVVLTIWYKVMEQAHCDFSLVQWGAVASAGLTALIGLLSHDQPKEPVKPA